MHDIATTLFHETVSWMSTHDPDAEEDDVPELPEPADIDCIGELRIRWAVPAELLELLAAMDGSDDVPVLFGRWSLLTAEEMMSEADCNLGTVVNAADPWFRKEWIPFAGDGSGNFLVVDERTGAVTEAANDGEPWELHDAPDLLSLLQRALAELRAGKITWNEDDMGPMYAGYAEA